MDLPSSDDIDRWPRGSKHELENKTETECRNRKRKKYFFLFYSLPATGDTWEGKSCLMNSTTALINCQDTHTHYCSIISLTYDVLKGEGEKWQMLVMRMKLLVDDAFGEDGDEMKMLVSASVSMYRECVCYCCCCYCCCSSCFVSQLNSLTCLLSDTHEIWPFMALTWKKKERERERELMKQ